MFDVFHSPAVMLADASNSFLVRLLGAGRGEDIPPDATAELVWENLPSSWGVFVLIAIVLLLLWLVIRTYRDETDPGRRWVKPVCIGLRSLALLSILLIFLAPAIRINLQSKIQPHVAVIRDASDSMNIADRYINDEDAARAARALGVTSERLRSDKPTRADLVNKVLEGKGGAGSDDSEDLSFVDGLSERGLLRVYDVAEGVSRVDKQTEGVKTNEQDIATVEIPPLEPKGLSTDLHAGLREALADKQTSAAILFTDGQHTAPGNLADLAAEAGSRRLPIFVVGVGDPIPPRNVSVSDIYADAQVWVKDPFEAKVTLRAEGVPGETVEVEFYEIEGEGDARSENILESRSVQLPDEDGPVRLEFKHKPMEAGRRSYGVRVSPLSDEQSEEDNRAPAPAVVKVLDQKAKVLLVAGGPTWEYRNLHVLLTREKFIEVDCWLQTIDDGRPQAGNNSITSLPATKEDLFDYDVIVMLDPKPADLSPEWIDLCREFVRDHAGGLFYLAGPRYAADFLTSPTTRALRSVIPVRVSDMGEMDVAALLAINTRDWPMGTVNENGDHPVLRLTNDPEGNLRMWRTLPGVFWSFPIKDPKPAAKVLLEHSNPNLRTFDGARPLFVAGQYGSGRTLYLGFTGTWRWRQVGANTEFYNKFWVQATRYLIEGRAMEGQRRGTLESEKDRYQIGDRVQLSARLKDMSFEPLEEEEVVATMVLPDKTREEVTLKAVPNQAGRYQATLLGETPGLHILQLELPNRDTDPTIMESDFTVTLPQIETRAIWLDKQRLRQIASLSGGKYFEIDEAANLVDQVPNRTQILNTQGPSRPIWDKLRLLIFMISCLCLEWLLRKRYKMM